MSVNRYSDPWYRLDRFFDHADLGFIVVCAIPVAIAVALVAMVVALMFLVYTCTMVPFAALGWIVNKIWARL